MGRAPETDSKTPPLAPAPGYAAYVRERNDTSWERYIRELARVGRLVVIHGVHIDGESVFRRRFECDTCTCAPGKNPLTGESWRASGEKSCCAELAVDLTPTEIEGLKQHWGPIRDYLGARNWFYRGKVVEDFVELDVDYETVLKKRGGRCVFALKDPDHGIRCGIHSACLAKKIPVHEAKPVTCDTFPLIVIDLSPGRWYLGAHDDDVNGISSLGDDGIDAFPCLANRLKGRRLYEAMGDTIRLYFGKGFYEELCRAAQRYLAGPKPKRLVPPDER